MSNYLYMHISFEYAVSNTYMHTVCMYIHTYNIHCIHIYVCVRACVYFPLCVCILGNGSITKIVCVQVILIFLLISNLYLTLCCNVILYNTRYEFYFSLYFMSCLYENISDVKKIFFELSLGKVILPNW